jgi:hypothetical protein
MAGMASTTTRGLAEHAASCQFLRLFLRLNPSDLCRYVDGVVVFEFAEVVVVSTICVFDSELRNRCTPDTFHIIVIHGRLRARITTRVMRCRRDRSNVGTFGRAMSPSGRSASPDGDHNNIRVEVRTKREISLHVRTF